MHDIKGFELPCNSLNGEQTEQEQTRYFKDCYWFNQYPSELHFLVLGSSAVNECQKSCF